MRIVLTVGMFAAIIAAAVLAYVNLTPAPYDTTFNTSVSAPAYAGAAPLVLYDEGHRNCHASTRGYRPFVELARSDGYKVDVLASQITSERLRGASVLVIVCARGANDAGDASAFTAAEGEALVRWVREGGSLLLVTDHWPYGAAAEELAARFGVHMGKGFVADERNFEASRESSHLVFSRANGLLLDHAITRGRGPSERVERVVSFTGQSVWGPAQASALLSLAETAVESPPTAPLVEKEGGDVRVSMTYGTPVSASGRAQGVMLELAQGRVVVLGEAGMISAQFDQKDRPVGMNMPGYHNRQLTLNILHWLSRLI